MSTLYLSLVLFRVIYAQLRGDRQIELDVTAAFDLGLDAVFDSASAFDQAARFVHVLAVQCEGDLWANFGFKARQLWNWRGELFVEPVR